MLLRPRYDDTSLLTLKVSGDDPAIPLLRQRRRLGDALAALDDASWAAPSRCDAWTVQDVIAHLVGTNQFWVLSISAGLAGEPTRYLGSFDPVATPQVMVASMRELAPAEVLDQYRSSVADLGAVVTDLDAASWEKLGEAPPGHVSLRAVAMHALWDAWVHERDVLLPLGLAVAEEADEILGSLRYAAGLGPAFSRTAGSTQHGRLGVVATDPDISFVVDIADDVVIADGQVPEGTPTLAGDAITLLEGLSFRLPLDHGLDDADRWLVGGLDEVFDLV